MTSHLLQIVIIFFFIYLLSVFNTFCMNFLVPGADFYKPVFIPALPPSRSVKLHFVSFWIVSHGSSSFLFDDEKSPGMINLFLNCLKS